MNPRTLALLKTAIADSFDGRRVKVPEAGRLLWEWFADLSQARTWHMAGPNPIPYTEIAAYSALMGWPLSPADVVDIVALDRAYMAAWSAARAKPEETAEGVRKLPPRSSAVLAPELFDAMVG